MALRREAEGNLLVAGGLIGAALGVSPADPQAMAGISLLAEAIMSIIAIRRGFGG